MSEIRLRLLQAFLSSLGGSDVHHRADEFQTASLVPDSSADDVNISDRLIRHQQAVLKIEIPPGAGSLLDQSLYKHQIFRMDSFYHHLNIGKRRRLVAEN